MDFTSQSNSEPAATLALIARAAQAARQDCAAVWFPLLLSGMATLASPTAISLIGGAAAPAWYWAAVGPLIGVSCGAFYARRRVQPSLAISRSAVLVSAGIIVAALALGLLVEGPARVALPWIAVSGGLAVFSQLYRSPLVGLVALVNAGGAGWLLLDSSAQAQAWHALLVGVACCLTALAAMSGSDRTRASLT
jgi:hypothetical protein